MKVITKSKTGSNVGHALETLVTEINEDLKGVDGVITNTQYDISAGPAGACVSITLVLNGNSPIRKELVGVNEKGVSREHSMKKAGAKLSELLENKKGKIADVYTKTIVTPLPGRVYTTVIAAVNEEVLEKARNSDIRRNRIKKILELLNNDPSAINVARVAEVFGVSRTMIYRDLEALGFKRGTFKEIKET